MKSFHALLTFAIMFSIACSFILFESNGAYQDLGGSIDPSDYQTGIPVSTAAKREALEESAGYLEIRMNLNQN